VECVEWECREQERNAEVRQVGKETDKRVKLYASSVKTLANSSGSVVLLELGELWQQPDRRGNLRNKNRYRYNECFIGCQQNLLGFV
jgi:hypothetical protein